MPTTIRRAVHDTTGYHTRIKEGSMAEELTLSHKLREPNSFIDGGYSFGEALARVLIAKGLVPAKKIHVGEGGGGKGDVAAKSIPVLLKHCGDLRCTMVELSPKLEQQQRAATREFDSRVTHIRGNVEEIGRLVDPMDLFLSIEMVGDLSVIKDVPLTRGGEPTGESRGKPASADDRRAWGEAWDLIEKYGIPIPKEGQVDSFVVSSGTIQMIEGLWSALKPGGAAVITEAASEFPRLSPQFEHDEYFMSVPQLTPVAEGCGFIVESDSVNELVGIDPEKVAVDGEQVNLWLHMEKDEAGTLFKPDLGIIRRASVLDKFVTVDEFTRIAPEIGFDGAPPIQKVGGFSNRFKYLILRKQAD